MGSKCLLASPCRQISTVEEKHQEAAEEAAAAKAGGRKRKGGAATAAAKKAKPDLAALTQVWPHPCTRCPCVHGCHGLRTQWMLRTPSLS